MFSVSQRPEKWPGHGATASGMQVKNPLAVVVCFPCSVCFSGLCDCMVSMLVSHIGYTLLADAPWNLKKHIVKIEKIFVFFENNMKTN